MVKIRRSYGIALCRYNPQKNNQVEILLIKKRHTYCFLSLISGQYKEGDEKYIRHLLNNMTISEKITLYSLDFNIIWSRSTSINPNIFVNKIHQDKNDNRKIYRKNEYRSYSTNSAWVNDDNYNKNFYNNFNNYQNRQNFSDFKYKNNFYNDHSKNSSYKYGDKNSFSDITKSKPNLNKNFCSNSKLHKSFFNKKNKFEKNFVERDNGKAFRYWIQQSIDSNTLWEIPKGGQKKIETALDAAIREFTEETNISESKIQILHEYQPLFYRHKDAGIEYHNFYYIAKLRDNLTENQYQKIYQNPIINLKNKDQVNEVEELKWVGVSELNFLQLKNRNLKHLDVLFKKIIRRFKKHNKIQFR